MATLDVIKTITIRGSAEGVAEVERQLARVAAGMEEVTVASGKQEKATLSVEAAYRKLQARYDQEFRAQQQLAQVQRTLERAQAQGLVSQERASELMQQAIVFHNRTATATAGSAQALGQFGNQSKAARYELINLSRQIQDVGVSLASGQSPFTVLIQQGSQVADVFASSQLTMQQWAQRFLSFFTPARLLILGFTAAVGALALAWIKLRDTGPDVEATFKSQADVLNVVQRAYRDSTKAAGEFLEQSEAITRSKIRQNLIDLQKILEQQSTALIKATTTPVSVPSELPLPFGVQALENVTKVTTGFRELDVVVTKLNESAKGAADWQAYRDALAELFNTTVQTNPALAEAAKHLLETSELAGRTALAIQKAQAEMAVMDGTATGWQRKLLGLNAELKSDAWDQFIQKTREAIEITRLEAQEVGKSAAEVRKLRIEFDAQRAAKQAGREVDRGAVEALKNEAAAAEDFKKASQDAFQAGEKVRKLMEDLARERETVFFSKEDQAIAERLKDLYPDVTEAINSAEAAQIRFNNRIKEAVDLTGDFINTLISGLIKGESLTKSLTSAMQGLGSALIRAGSQNIATSFIGAPGVGGAAGTGITGGIAGLFPSLGAAAGPVGALGGLAVGAGISLLGQLFGGGDEDQRAAQELAAAQQKIAEEAQRAAEALGAATDSMKELVRTIKGPFETALDDGRKRLEEMHRVVRESNAAQRILIATFGPGSPQGQAAQANIDDAQRRLQEAGEIFSEFTENLRRDLVEDLQSKLREAQGQGFLNQFFDLFREIRQARSDAAALGVDVGSLIDQLFSTKAQSLINQLKLTGDQFETLLQTFPELRNVVVEFNEAIVISRRSVDELRRASESLDDRILAATVDANTLEGALALFDRRAQREIQAEIEAGGENIIKLEQALALERLNIVEDFNARSLELERQRIDQLTSFARDIVTYVNSLFAGPESALSPSGRLQQAQSAFTSQLTLAQAGNEDALATITKFAEDYRQAAQAFFGSSTQYQTILGQISAALIALPAVSASEDPVVQALVNTVTPAIQATTTAVGGTTTAVGGTTSAVNTNTTATNQTTSAVSSVDLQIQATNSLAAAANSLATSANTFLNSINSLISTQQATLNSINNLAGFLVSIENEARETNDNLTFIKERQLEISSHTSHMFAPGGSIQFLLAQGGWVGVNDNSTGAQVYRRAYGGPIGTDTVPAMLTPGEFVVRKSVAQANASNLASLNQTGRWSGNDNVERLLAIICEKLDINISAIVGQTVAVTRETRFAARRRNAA